MNRLLKAAAALCALAIPMSAQVQIGKNVQLGAATAGGAANPAAPAFCVQSANAGVNGFQCDPQILINPTAHTLTAPNVNSFINSDLFNTGGGNNGVPNAIGSPICSSGCTLQVPSNTPNTINPAANSAFENSIKTSIWDQTGGAFWYTSNNAASNEQGPTVHFPLVFQASYNLDPIGVGTESGGGMALTDLESSSGFDITGQPTVRTGLQLEAICNTPGICQAMHITQFGLGGDDKGGLYIDQDVRANNTAGASEGNQMVSFEQAEAVSTAATVVTGGQGTNNILTNVRVAWGVNLFLESSTEVYASGGITSLTLSGGLDPNIVNTTDTHAVVNTVGTLTSPCGTPANNNNKISETCSVTNSGSINKGTFCVTGAWNGSSCVGSTHVAVMIADTVNPECSTITSIGSGTITLGTSFSHPTGTRIFQSPATCGEIFLGDGGGFGAVIQRGFRIAGALTPTSWSYIFNVKNDQNGKQQIVLLPQLSQTITSLVRSGTTVTATMANPAAAEFNGIPTIGTTCVVGNSNSALNECGVTSIVATNGGVTLTYTSTGSGSQTGTGGTLSVLDSATHTYPGLWNYEVACGGMVTKVGGVTAPTGGGNGSMELEANNCAWGTGTAVVQPNSQAQSFSGLRVFSNAFTLPDQGGNVLVNFGTQGVAWSSGTMVSIGQETHEPITSFLGYGGLFTPMTMFNIINPGTSTEFSIANAPIKNLTTGGTGAVFAIGKLPDGGPGNTTYDLFQLGGAISGQGANLTFDTATNSLTLTGSPAPSFTANTLVAGFQIILNVAASSDPAGLLGSMIAMNGTEADYLSQRMIAGELFGPTHDWFFDNTFGNTFRFRTANSGASAYVDDLDIAATGIAINVPLTLTGTSNGCATFTSGVLGSTGSACGSGSGTGFPINLGSTSISGSSTTTSVAGLTVNGVVLNAAGSATLFLNQAGGYTAPSGGGAVSSVSNSDGTLTISPTTGAVVASLALGHANTWTGLQTLVGTNITGVPLTTGITGILGSTHGGTGVNNSATLTLGSSNQNWATIGTGLVKVTTTTGAISDAVSADVIALWSGICSSSTFLRGDGACAAPSGSGNTTSTSLTTNTITKANGANSIINSGLTDDGTTITATEAFAVNDSSGLGGGFDGTEGTAHTGATSVDNLWADSTAHRLKMINNNGSATNIVGFSDLASSSLFGVVKVDGTTITASGGVISAVSGGTTTIASGISALGTSSISSGACATVVTTTATGAASTDGIIWNPNGSIKAVTGYTPSTSGGLTIAGYPTSGNVNFDVCNWTASSITPGAVTLNWRIVR